MAGFRLAPVAARRRRQPWQRRRVHFSRGANQSVAVGTAVETDTGVALLYVPQNIVLGVALETDAAVSIAATGQNAGQAGLYWLWQVGAEAQSVTVGTASETDAAVAVVVVADQAIAVGTASEADYAFAITATPESVIVVTERRHRAYRYRRRGGEW